MTQCWGGKWKNASVFFYILNKTACFSNDLSHQHQANMALVNSIGVVTDDMSSPGMVANQPSNLFAATSVWKKYPGKVAELKCIAS